MNEVILDVRERDEFEAERIEHSINLPLSHFDSIAPGVLAQVEGKGVVILCRSGARARLALERLQVLGYTKKIPFRIYEGGILEWKREGGATLRKKRAHLPIMRQVQLIAGSCVFISTMLGALVHPGFLAISGFFGAGLAFAGATGFCGLAIVLSKMPWNRNGESEVC
jgi:rhodanese-related sulfurtransferase